MESDIAVDVFSRSAEKHNLIYKSFIGDGDTSSFRRALEDNPYGNEHPVEK